eukprot:GFUD01008389.1.p1 GENE.GFUD01008389.1~~GFUD01008389.1.p1  ORF type:complete len:126 (+),score=39.58 GFUD01008389.1:1-378(+)
MDRERRVEQTGLSSRKMSTNSTMFENPFRAGGELSKDADEIINAIKTGKLSVISNVEQAESQEGLLLTGDEEEDEKKEYLVKPLVRKNGVLEVHHVPAVTIKEDKAGQDMFENVNEKTKQCCAVL